MFRDHLQIRYTHHLSAPIRPPRGARVLQEPAHIAHRGRLQHQPEPVVLAPPIPDQLLIDLIEDEEPLQVSPRRHTLKTPVPGDLRISQKFQRHAPRTPDPRSATATSPSPPRTAER
jgi:hypothetical protein